MSAHDATATHYCKFPGCANESKSSRGPYSYCEKHRGLSRNVETATGVAADLRALISLATAADRAEEKARKATTKALQLKRVADTARGDFNAALVRATAPKAES